MKRILVAIDGSDHAWDALDVAMPYANAMNSDLIMLHVVPRGKGPVEPEDLADIETIDLNDAGQPWHEKASLDPEIGREAERRLRKGGVRSFHLVIREGDVAEMILHVANALHVQMIFVGYRGFGTAERSSIGSVAQKVANLARCTCVIVK